VATRDANDCMSVEIMSAIFVLISPAAMGLSWNTGLSCTVQGRVLVQVNNRIESGKLSRAEDGSAAGDRRLAGGRERRLARHMAGWPKGSWSSQEPRAANASLLRLPSVYLPLTSHLALLPALNCTQWQQLIRKYPQINRPFDLLFLNTPASWYRQHPTIPAHTLANASRDRQPSTPY
jgi:hypothetical protein